MVIARRIESPTAHPERSSRPGRGRPPGSHQAFESLTSQEELRRFSMVAAGELGGRHRIRSDRLLEPRRPAARGAEEAEVLVRSAPSPRR